MWIVDFKKYFLGWISILVFRNTKCEIEGQRHMPMNISNLFLHPASMTCRGEGTDITVIVPTGFKGEVYSTQSGEATDDMVPEECQFKADTVRDDGYIPYKFTIPFDRSSACVNATLNVTENEVSYYYILKYFYSSVFL